MLACVLFDPTAARHHLKKEWFTEEKIWFAIVYFVKYPVRDFYDAVSFCMSHNISFSELFEMERRGEFITALSRIYVEELKHRHALRGLNESRT